MAELKIYISDDLNERFRRIAMSVHGYGRGSLSKAAEEAFTKWCAEREPSSTSTREVDRSEAVHDQPKEIESRINPDERVGASQGATRIRDDKPGGQASTST
jgi:post-segregation antitoxin (ccd killing protein)